jgi:membrane protease subunit HflK
VLDDQRGDGLRNRLLRWVRTLPRPDVYAPLLSGGRGYLVAAAAILVVWGLSGFYRVQPDEQGVELLFGRYVATTQPGLNYWFSSPIGSVIKPKVTRTNQATIGFRDAGGSRTPVTHESLILTGDQNIVDIQFVVQWRISDARAFLFNLRNPEGTVKIAAESALREIVGASGLTAIVTNQRDSLAIEAKDLLQSILDEYQAGIAVLDLRIQQADPPKEVVDAFNDVQRAKQDGERLRNEALAYRNDIVPRARGDAARNVQNALAQKERLVKEAEGQAARFSAIHATYAANKGITMTRMYLETMQYVLSRSTVIIIDQNGNGVVPALPLPEIRKRAQANEAAR